MPRKLSSSFFRISHFENMPQIWRHGNRSSADGDGGVPTSRRSSLSPLRRHPMSCCTWRASMGRLFRMPPDCRRLFRPLCPQGTTTRSCSENFCFNALFFGIQIAEDWRALTHFPRGCKKNNSEENFYDHSKRYATEPIRISKELRTQASCRPVCHEHRSCWSEMWHVAGNWSPAFTASPFGGVCTVPGKYVVSFAFFAILIAILLFSISVDSSEPHFPFANCPIEHFMAFFWAVHCDDMFFWWSAYMSGFKGST